MRRFSRSACAALVLAALAAGAPAQDAERTVPVHQEPRHRMVFESGPTRILRVLVLPGDRTLWHVHATPILYVPVGPATEVRIQNRGAEWRGPLQPFPPAPPSRVSSDVSYAETPLTHRIENVGSETLQLIAVLNSSKGETERTPKEAGFESEPELEDGWFRAYRTTVAPGESIRHVHRAAVVVVQTGEGRALGTGNRTYGFNEPASWGYFGGGEEHELRNRGDSPIELVEVEIREAR